MSTATFPQVGRRPVAPAGAASTTAPDGHAAPLAGLSIVLPCFNEEDNVVEAVRAAQLAGSRSALAHEVIVVDDGSSDRTRERALALAESDPTVRLIVHDGNRGYGAAVRSGIAAAGRPWTLLTDADLQFDLTQIEDFLPFAADHDLIVGRRVMRMDPFGRRAAAAAWNRLVRAVFGLPVADVDCAFKLVRTELVADLPLTADGAMISTELLVRCLERGARIKQLPVRHRPRVAGAQSGTNPRVVMRAFRELFSARRDLGRLHRA